MSNGAARWVFKGVRTPKRKRLQMAGRAGFTSVADGYLIADVELTVELARLAQFLGARAIKNSRRRCSLAGGLIKVKVIGDVLHEAAS